VVAALLATASTTTVVLAWTGSYDVFTVVLASFLVVVRSPRLAALIGVLLAASALEHGAIIVALLLALALAGIQGEPRALAATACGLLAGGIALVVWLRWQHVVNGRAYWLSNYGIRYFLDMAVHSWPLLLFSLFGAAWPLAAAALAAVEPRRRLVAACVLAAPIIPMLVSEDETRVFAVLSFPILLALVVAAADRAPALVQRAAVASVALAVVIPGYFVWKGTAHLADWGPWTALLR
jgi:hypothetical protein